MNINSLDLGREIDTPVDEAGMSDTSQEASAPEDQDGIVVETPKPDVHIDPIFQILGTAGGNNNGLGGRNYGQNKILKARNEEELTIPDEILAVFQAHGLNNRRFLCSLRECPEGSSGDSHDERHVRSWSRSIPTLDYIGSEYGPGNYALIFTWAQQENGKKVTKTERVIITISDKYEDIYHQRRLERKLEAKNKLNRKIRDDRINSEIERNIDIGEKEGGPASEIEAGKKFVSYIAEAQRSLFPQHIAPKGIDWEKILPVLVPAVTAAVGGIFKMLSNQGSGSNQMFEKMLMLLMAQQEKNSSQMLEIMKLNQSPQKGTDMMKETFDMIRDAIDIKELMTGKKDSVADRIFNMIEGALPQIMTIATMTAQQRAQNPFLGVVASQIKNMPDIKAMQKDPSVLMELINKCDNYYGWEQTDKILEVAGMARPEECPQLPSQRYASGDPRNEGIEEDSQDTSVQEEDHGPSESNQGR